MPALIHIEEGQPVGWITAPDMPTLFNMASNTDMRDNSHLMNQLYYLRDAIDCGFDNGEPKRELEPGIWLLLD
jgi:hypothetical protein